MKFAIIIPFYNAEKRLKVSINSVIKQSYRFLEHVEVLLINDGSTDNSGIIANHYAEKYPKNIRVLNIPNGGPAKARNIGIHNVREDTDFVGFLDADDVLSSNMLEKMAAFLNQSNVNMVVPAFYYLDDFGKKQKIAPHKLNYRFKNGDRMVNIEEEPQAIHYYIGGTFLRYKSLQEFSFAEELYFGEDQLLITQFLLKNRTYGLIADAGYYYYRDMKQKGSLVSSSWKKNERYTAFLEKVYQTYIADSQKEFGSVIPYIKTLIAYHAKLFFYKENVYFKEVLSEAEQEGFVVELQRILKVVGANTILALDTPLVVKEMMLSIMRNGWPVQFEMEPLSEVPLVSIKEVYRIGKPAVVELSLEEQRQSLPNEGQFILGASTDSSSAKLITRKSDQKIWDISVRKAGSIERAVFNLKQFQNKVAIFYKDRYKKTSIIELRVMNSLLAKIKRNIKLKRDFK